MMRHRSTKLNNLKFFSKSFISNLLFPPNQEEEQEQRKCSESFGKKSYKETEEEKATTDSSVTTDLWRVFILVVRETDLVKMLN